MENIHVQKIWQHGIYHSNGRGDMFAQENNISQDEIKLEEFTKERLKLISLRPTQ